MILHLFRWAATTGLGVFMRDSRYAFAVVEMVHLLALALLGGIVLAINCSVLGIGLKQRAASRISAELRPLLYGSIAAIAITGVLLVFNQPFKYYFNSAFRMKMALLATALLVQFTIARILRFKNERGIPIRLLAGLALVLWLGTGLAGRAIGVL